MRKRYVVGFLLGDSLVDVALIRKQKPAWQAGLLNGIGGKIEPDESEVDAMEREFMEEAGVRVKCWSLFCEMSRPGWVVYCFAARYSLALVRCMTQEDEQVVIVDWNKSKEPTIPNLSWLVPMAMDYFRSPSVTTVHYSE